jgi:copper transport protein
MRRILIILALACIAVGGLASPATAHAALSSSDPVEGATLEAAPARVMLTFTEPPDPELSTIEVLNAAGAEVQEGNPRAVPGDRLSLEIDLPADLPDGVYTVAWRALSTTDQHQTARAFAFGVGVDANDVVVRPGTDVVTTPGPSPLGVSGKTLLYLGLALLLAAGALGLAVFGGEVPGGRTLMWGAATATTIGAALLIVSEAMSADVSVSALLSSATGVPLIRLAGTSVVTVGCVVAVLRRRTNLTLGLLAASASTTMLMRAWAGHAGGSVLEVALQWSHFSAIGLWVGGLALIGLRLHARSGDAAPIAEIRRFSAIAGWSLVIVVSTGSLRALNELGWFGQWRRLFDESYGITLLAKIAVAALLIGLGAINRYRRIPALERGERAATFTSVLRAEVVLAAGLVVLTALLTSFPPQGVAATTDRVAPTKLVVSGSDFATTMNVRLTIDPGTVGSNAFRIDVTDFDTGEPLALNTVSLRLEPEADPSVGPSSLQLERIGDAWEARGPQVGLSGPWKATVVIQGPGFAGEIPLHFRPRLEQTVSVAKSAGQPDIYTIGLVGGVQLQMYLDPDTPGTSQLHLTAFGPDGQELPLADATFIGEGPSSSPRLLAATQLTPGHFAADLELSVGVWTFDVRATSESGDTLLASFQQTIGEPG